MFLYQLESTTFIAVLIPFGLILNWIHTNKWLITNFPGDIHLVKEEKVFFVSGNSCF